MYSLPIESGAVARSDEKRGHASGVSMDFRKEREQWWVAQNDRDGPSRFDEIGSRLNTRPIKSESLAHRTFEEKTATRGVAGIRKKDDSRPSNDPSAFCLFAFSFSPPFSSPFLSFSPPLSSIAIAGKLAGRFVDA